MGIKILLADDSVTAQNMGKKILSEAGHEVVTVSNGAAAAKKISEVKPDLVLLDVFMPGYSGLELCEKLRKSADTSKLPVLLTVGRMEPYSPQEGARVKADGVIVKPFESSDLIAAVERLAQKLKPGKAVDYAHTIRIAPPANFKEDTYLAWKQEAEKQIEAQKQAQESQAAEPESQDAPMSATQIFGSKPPETYERTMRLDAKQIAELLKQAAAETPAPEASTAPVKSFTEEFQVAAPAHPPEFHSPDTSLPAFGADLPHAAPAEEPHRASVPSFMGEYLSDHPDARPEPQAVASVPEELEDTIVMGPGQAPTPVAPVPPESALQRFAADASTAVPTASAEGLELTAAPPVPDMAVVHESALDTTSPASDAPTIVLRDPALIDVQSATAAFPTHFSGTELAGSEVLGQTESAAAPGDEFEARLKAAMESYSATELPTSTHTQESSVPEIHAIEESFEAKLESAVHAVEAPAESTGDISLETSWSMPKASNSLEHAVNAFEQSNVKEPPAFEVSAHDASVLPELHHLEPPVVDAVSRTILKSSEPEPAAIHETSIHETDDAVIQQMRESLSDFPVDSARLVESAEPESMAMAAAATASAAPIAAPASSGQQAELEIARALSAAVDSESPSEHAVRAESESFSSEMVTDANKVAAAVEKVMKRELPTLIWKIMAELDLHKR